MTQRRRLAAPRPFWAAHRDRLFVTRLPSYSPDYNPIEFLWRATKRRATHNRYFPCPGPAGVSRAYSITRGASPATWWLRLPRNA